MISQKRRALWLILGCTLMLTGCHSYVKNDDTDITTTEYVSSDGNLTINLPGNDWQMDEESEELYIFSSSDGIVMLTHSENASGEMYPETAKDIGMILDIEGYYSEGYEVTEFYQLEVGGIKSFKSVIQYTEGDTVYECGILHGVLVGNDVYMSSAMLTKYNEALIESMKECVYGYCWQVEEGLDNPVEVEEVTPEPTKEVTPEPTKEVTPEPTKEVTPEPTKEVTPKPKRKVTPVPEGDITELSKKGVCHSAAYVRNAPDSESDVIGSVTEGQNVKITGEIRNWYRIKYNGETAYVCKDYVK